MDKIIYASQEKLTTEQIKDYYDQYTSSKEYKRLKIYNEYYDAENVDITERHADREIRRKTPNNKIPTGYYGTLVDTMSGFMFQNVSYVSDNEAYTKELNAVLDDNDGDVKDMLTGSYGLIYNKAIELVYSVGDGEKDFDVKFAAFSPENWILLWTPEIESKLFCAIRFYDSLEEDWNKYLDVIYQDEWQYWKMKDDKIVQREEPRQLFFDENPVCCYRTKLISNKSVFDKVIPYIDALDYLISGNSNEIERLVDAILVIGKVLQEEDKLHVDEWKILENMKTEDRAEYITKDMSPEFRKYVSQLLIQEIHKHSHVIDWYSPDTGLTGEVSAKALRTRLFDMDMFSQKIEKIYKEATYKRIRLINKLLSAKSVNVDDNVTVIYNRTLPDDKVDKIVALQNTTWVSDQTKCEESGLDWETEKLRKEEEMDLPYKQIDFGMDNTEDTDEENESDSE